MRSAKFFVQCLSLFLWPKIQPWRNALDSRGSHAEYDLDALGNGPDVGYRGCDLIRIIAGAERRMRPAQNISVPPRAWQRPVHRVLAMPTCEPRVWARPPRGRDRQLDGGNLGFKAFYALSKFGKGMCHGMEGTGSLRLRLASRSRVCIVQGPARGSIMAVKLARARGRVRHLLGLR